MIWMTRHKALTAAIMALAIAGLGIGYLYYQGHRTYCYGYQNNQCIYMTSQEFRDYTDQKAKDSIGTQGMDQPEHPASTLQTI